MSTSIYNASMKTYRIGGAVRDKLLNYPSHENDWVVVGASPEEMLNQGFKPVGRDFPVFLHPETGEEYALARTERKSGVGYQGFTFHTAKNVTLEEDLKRRDLTINAMAEDSNGHLIDPYSGQQDLEQKVLRHVSPAFTEDPLRVLRVARFAARYHHLGFTIAPETQQLMSHIVDSGELSYLAAERVWKETCRALGESSPDIYIQVLRNCEALAALLPEVDCLFGIPQRADYHPEIDTGLHTLMALQQATRLSSDPMVRFATLVHDLGKGATPVDILPRHIGHETAGVALVNTLCDRLSVPNNYRKLALAVTEYHLLCHEALTLKPSTVLKMLKNTSSLKSQQQLENFLLSCEADARGRTGFEECDYPQAEYLRKAWQAIQTSDVSDLVERGINGAEIGRQLAQRQTAKISEVKSRYE